MPAVWLLRAELHGRWRAWLAWVVAAGAVSGLVLAATAGARRADSALERYRAFSHATDVFVGTGAVFGGQGLDLARVRGLPEVAAATRGILPAQDIRARSGRSVSSSVAIEISPDAGNLRAIDRPKLLAGRLPAPERDDEAIADRRAVRILGLGLGDIVHARLQVGRTARPGPAVALRIVGIRPDSSSANTTSFLSTTPAFYRAHGGRALLLAAWRSSLKIRLRHGSADLPAFQRRTERIAGGRDFEFVPVELEVAKMQSPLHLQAEALGIVAALAAFGGLLVLGGGLARMMELESRKHPMLFALGMTRRQIAWLTIGRAAIAGLAAAAISVPVAIALSPLTPIERARDYEPHPGVAVDGIVLGVGAAIVIAAALLSGLAAAARAVGTRSLPAGAETGSGGSWVAALGRAGLPPPLVAGVRMAAPSSHSPARGPARATVVGAVLAVALAATALTFSASLSHLLRTPRLSGLTWDYANFQGSGTARDLARMRSDASIAGLAYGEEATLDIGGRHVGAAAYDQVKGDVRPTVISGRAPATEGEVLLGTKTFDENRARLGGRIEIRRGARMVRMRVVGRGILPEDEWLNQGEGAAMTFGSLKRLVPGAFRSRFLIRVSGDADREAVLRRLEALWGVPPPALPRDVADFGGVGGMPSIIVLLVGVAAAVALARNLLSSVTRHRRELAVLQTLGFTRGQVRATVAWHATNVAMVAALVGVPVGVGAGRWAWNLFADHLGVAPEAVTPVGTTLLAVPAVLLLANVVAALPGRVAARTRPALVLRAE